MKVLFLDIDGVLNSTSFKGLKLAEKIPGFGNMPAWQKEAEVGLDPENIKHLNTIVEVTNCVVVLSSTWRKGNSLTRLTRQLRYKGFKDRLFAATPHLCHEVEGKIENFARGAEIEWWLSKAGINKSSCAILDDDTDMLDLYDRLVHVDYQVGLTAADTIKVIELLS